MGKNFKLIALTVIALVLLAGSFFLLNREEGEADPITSFTEGEYHYGVADPMIIAEGDKIFYTMMLDQADRPVYMVESKDGCFIYRGFGEERKIISPDVRPKGEDLNVKGFTMDEEGNLYVLYGVFRGKETMNIYDKKGNLIKEAIPMEGDLSEIKYMNYANGKLYLLDFDRNFQVHTPDGKLTNDVFDLEGIRSVDMDEAGNLYFLVVAPGVHRLVKVDGRSNQQIFSTDLTIPSQMIVRYSKGDNCIYTTEGKYLYQFDGSGNLIKRELEFTTDVALAFGEFDDVRISGLGRSLDNLLWDGRGNCLLLSVGTDGTASYLYPMDRKQGSKPPEAPKQEIRLTAAYEQDFLKTAIGLYNMQSDKYKVVLEAPYKSYEEFMGHYIEAGEKLAVQIMTNDVGDIVATGGNGLVYYDQLRTDAFMDLTELIGQHKDYRDLNPEVLKGLTFDGALRGLPIGVAYYRVVYNKTLGDSLGLNLDLDHISWSEVLHLAIQLAEEGKDVRVFSTQESTPDTYFTLLLQANMPDLIDLEKKTVALNQPWFLELVSNYKIASKLPTFMEQRRYDGRNLTGNNALFYFNNLRGDHISEVLAPAPDAPEVMHLPVFTGENHRNAIAYPVVMYSISNSSTQKEGAWDFLSFLLDRDIQCLTSLNAHPVNLRAEEKIRAYYEFDQQRAAEHDQIIHRVDFMYDMSYYKEDITVPMMEYFNDLITLEEAIQKAEHNVWLRLNE